MGIPSNSNRSPSPNSSRIQENSCIRKSFSGDPLNRPSIVPFPRGFNPVTPANSPADFPQKNSGQREGLASLRVSYEQKENEKDQNLKSARFLRSPAISNGTKSFMAPTISASSKINASPRKKVLTEKNEAVRTSISFSAGKSPSTAVNPSEIAEEVSSKSQTISDSKVPSECPQKSDATLLSPTPDTLKSSANPNGDGAILNSEVPTETPDLLLFSSEPRAEDSICNNTNLGLKVKPSLSPSPVLAPLTLVSPAPDALKSSANPKGDGAVVNSEVPTETPDFSLLSPEPRADLGSKAKLSPSPSPVLAPLDMEPFLPPYDPKTNYLSPRPEFLHYKPNPRIDLGEGKRLLDSFSSESSSETENTEDFQSPSPQKECEDAGSPEMASGEEMNTIQNQNEFFRVNKTRKSHFFARSKSIPFLLVLVVACLCFPVTDTPIHYQSLFKTQTSSRLDSPVKFAELAKTKLDFLSHVVRLWSVNSASYLSNLISIPNEVEQIDSLKFMNSSPDEEHLAYECRAVDCGDNQTEETQDVETVEDVQGVIAEIQSNVEFEEQPQLIEQGLYIKPENPETGDFLDKGDFDSYTNDIEIAKGCRNIEIEEQSPLIPQAPDVESNILEADSNGENDSDSFTNIKPTCAESKPESSGSLQGSTYMFPERNVLAISSGIVALLVAALLYFKQNKASAPKVTVPVEQLVTKKFSLCSVSASSDHLNHDRTSTPIWPAEVEKMGESGPFEISSTLQGYSNSCKMAALDRTNEVQSHERKPRRSAKRGESLVSSSEFSAGSPSYGSFTTYEKIPIKHGSGDEGMVTPIRRSSRIRNQIISP
ncbi:hypothetical protein NE237_023679 [Protea cynaroides]|uniref:Uncharacterized protein n=1 Tax=Protea cynaroides TaxID=273540 RepID=A0A9Q0K6B2_9MAGN|nr:hypothetical protein NE237_023679 [Protea cynaroides]